VQRTLDVFLRRMRELGWIDGANVTILYRWADGDVARLPALAVELVDQGVDLIVAPNTASVVAARGVNQHDTHRDHLYERTGSSKSRVQSSTARRKCDGDYIYGWAGLRR
jgi:hypothetical protein